MTTTTNVRFKKDTKQSFRVLSTTTTVEVQSTKKKVQNFSNFVFCNLYSTRKGQRKKKLFREKKKYFRESRTLKVVQELLDC